MGVLAAFAATAAVAQPALADAVLAELNRARADPQAYAQTLRQYRGYISPKDKVARIPNDPVGRITVEGAVGVDEAIAFVLAQQPLPPLQQSDILAAAALDHANEQGPTGALGHNSASGLTPGERVMRRGGGKFVGEIIAYGSSDALSVVRQFIIDDGVPARGHRALIFEPRLIYAGIGCAPHRTFRTVCVGDMGQSPDGK